MKKMSVIVAIIAILGLVGCASSGGSSGGGAAGGGGGGAPYSVDVSTLTYVPLGSGDVPNFDAGVKGNKNPNPLTKAWDDVYLVFPELPANITAYQRLTVRAKYYDKDNNEISQGDSNCIVSLIYDHAGDKRGPAMGPGPNTPVKEFNVGGFSGLISTDKGVRTRFSKPPVAILFQNNHTGVGFIECTEITFHD